MKYLDNPVLAQLSAVLSANPTPEARVNARVESYSIKPVARERKMFKEMEEAYVSGQEEMDEMSFSPEMKEAGQLSCFGRLDVKESRKVHFLLVSTLNSAFPEYDFSALRPDHFTREISAPQVLSHLSSNLLAIDDVDLSPLSTVQPGSLPSSSPHAGPSSLPSAQTGSSPPTGDIGNLTFYRVLNDVVPLEDCEVYSWYPEPEYDPHVDPEETEEATEYEDSDTESDSGMDLDIDIDGEGPYVSWGQAGMELEMDGVPAAPSTRPQRRFSTNTLGTVDELTDISMSSPRLGPSDDWNPGRRVGELLWSANYFFYSKRQKRVLFITTWCRKRPSHERQPIDRGVTGSLPLPISSSFSPPSTYQALAPLPKNRSHRSGHHNLSNARPNHRRSKLAKLSATGKSLSSSTIPIRGMATSSGVPPATPSRLAASAPSTLSPITTPSRMNHGIKPRQTTARMLINAAAAQRPATTPTPTPASARATPARPVATNPTHVQDESRVRKERSGSLTPGPGSVLGMAEGKRVKV